MGSLITCTVCGETKKNSQFHKRRDKYETQCKACRREKLKAREADSRSVTLSNLWLKAAIK